MRLLLVLSLAIGAFALTSAPALPKDAMLTPPKDDFSDDMGTGDEPPPEPDKIPADMDPNQSPRDGDGDDEDADDESMIQKAPSDYKDAPEEEGDDANLLQTGEDPAPAAATDAAATTGAGAGAAAGAGAGSGAATDAAATTGAGSGAAAGSGADAGAGADAAAAGAGAGSGAANTAGDGQPPSGQNGPPGAGDQQSGGDSGSPPAGDQASNAVSPGAGAGAGAEEQAPAPPAEAGSAANRGPMGRLVNRPKETADPLYSSGTKINKNNAKIYKKVDYSPAKATERAALTEAQRVINKAKSKHIEFVEDTKEEIEKMLEA